MILRAEWQCLTCQLLEQVAEPGVAAARRAGQGREPARGRPQPGRPPTPRDGHHLLLSGSTLLKVLIIRSCKERAES